MRWKILTVLLLIKTVNSLFCFEGTNCEERNECDRCEGAACVRVVRPNRNHIFISDTPVTKSSNFFGEIIPTESINFYGPQAQVALTCLPTTSIFGPEPEGCRTDSLNKLLTCICYQNDFCNSAKKVQFYWTLNLIPVIILLRNFI